MSQDGYRDLRVPDDSGRPAREEVARPIYVSTRSPTSAAPARTASRSPTTCSKSSPGAVSSGQRQLTERPTVVGLCLQQSGHVRSPREDGAFPALWNGRWFKTHPGAMGAGGVEENLQHAQSPQIEGAKAG
ncbi:hypothetical protein, partial [Streptomyces sp. YS415]|uniref:hypothetical protein n=1 Tax=Streptomyces sp. YS415 TaxID=2944806 RepID=UPI0020220D56